MEPQTELRLTLFGRELAASEEESAFRLATWRERARRLRIVALAGALFYLAGFVVDLLLLGESEVIWSLLGIRAGVAVAIVAPIVAHTRSPLHPVRLDRTVTVVTLLTALATCVIIALSPGELIVHALTVIVILLVVYFFVPNRTLLTALSGLAFSAAFVVTAVTWLRPRPEELALVVLYLLLVNALGTLVSREVQATQRLQFATLETERQAREVLAREVGARVEAERALAASEERYRSLVELSPNAIVVHRDLRLLYLNPAAATLLGVENPAQFYGRSVVEYLAPESREPTKARFELLTATGAPLPPAEIRLLLTDGQLIDAEVVSSLTPFHDGIAVQSVLRDVSARKRLEEELRRLATIDPLTGARNRRSFFTQGEVEVRRAKRHDRPLGALMLDIDYFKRVNDNHGHAAGDKVLAALGEVCRSTLRSADLFGRLGGEEFAVLLPEVDAAAASAVAERLRQLLAEISVQVREERVGVTVSIGVSELAPADAVLDQLLKRADDALYAAKEAGRNCVHRA